jgi:uncharacterized protein (PEP-CTERM system associated)
MNSRRADGLHRRPAKPLSSSLHTRIGRGLAPPLTGLVALAALAAHAQEGGIQPRVTLVPELGIRETLTDNAHLTTGGGKTELITEFSPELRLSSNAGRIKGFFDYTVRGLVYARESSANNVQQTLSAAGTAEAVENWAYVDASASISQQNISALGTSSPDSALLNSNRTEVSSLRLSPYLHGRLGGIANYEARLNWQSTNSNSSTADSTTTGASLRLASDTSFARLGWSVDASHQVVDFHETGTNQTDRITGGLNYAATPELLLSVRAGHETNDLVSLNREGYRTWGWGATWTPTERTRLDAQREQRFFGSSHSVRFEHRLPRSVITFSDTRDVSTDAGGTGNGSGPRTVFDLLFAQAASNVPDPILREALVDTFLLNNGLTRASLINGGFLTSAVSLQRRTDFSFAWLGLRSTVIVSAFRNDARRLDAATVAADDLSNGNLLRQYGASVNVSQRLTPVSALSVVATRTKTTASVGAQQFTDLKALTATLSTRIRQNTEVSVSARHSVFASSTNPYTENAVIANLRLRF